MEPVVGVEVVETLILTYLRTEAEGGVMIGEVVETTGGDGIGTIEGEAGKGRIGENEASVVARVVEANGEAPAAIITGTAASRSRTIYIADEDH